MAKLKAKTENIQQAFKVQQEAAMKINGKISISLDAWTSSNMFAFMAIVANYVNKDGQLEELLIDFHKLIGEHSGENMAKMLLESIGALSKAGEKKAKSQSAEIFSAVDKLQKIVCAVCSSSQHKQSWLCQVAEELKKPENKTSRKQHTLMLILDVKTWWSSTHQMMSCALAHKHVIGNFVSLHKDLCALELSDKEWNAIVQVATWLKLFQTVTTEMLQTKQPMLSTTHL
ncbi:hypothetical protein H0H87_012272 [Tephrocybe sp. NHM501043]|nr:hypothetical protein H0H87_012272 [Tephrocybe sp. NHM501043]